MTFQHIAFCHENCLRPGPSGSGCVQCRHGYQGEGCCECGFDRVRVADKCVCPEGSLETAAGGCVSCRGDQVLSGDKCVCPTGTRELDGKCEGMFVC